MSTATEMHAKYLAAEQAVLEGKTVKFGERLLGMEDLSEIRAGRQEWERKVASEVEIIRRRGGNPRDHRQTSRRPCAGEWRAKC